MQEALAPSGAHMSGLDRRARGSRSRSSSRCGQLSEAKPRMPQVTAAHRRPVVGTSGGTKARSARTRPAGTENICQELPSDMVDMVYQECATAFVSRLVADAADDESGEEVEVEMSDSESDADVEDVTSKSLATPGEAHVLDILMRGTESGALMEALRPGPFPRVEEADSMKTGMLGTLLGGLRNGSLVGAIRQSQALREEEDVKAKESEAQEELRKTLFGALTSGLATGTLRTALGNATKQRQDREEVEKLKQVAQQQLSEGAANGGLDSALRKANEAREAESLRAEARRTLLSGIQTGSLFRALHGARKEEETADEVENLRTQARLVLTQGLHSGALARSLSDTTNNKAKDEQSEIEALRDQVKETFSKASADGSLDSVLGSMQEETMRQQLMETLVSGLKSGRLHQVMASASPATSSTPSVASSRKEEAELGEDEMEDDNVDSESVAEMEVLKAQAREALCSGLGSALAASLQALRGEPTPASIVASTLVEGLRTGALRTALESRTNGAEVVDATSDDEDWWNQANEEDDDSVDEDEDAEHLRAMAEQSLRDALANGRLSSALSSAFQLRPPGLYEEDREIETLRAMAETALTEGAASGRLAETLDSLRKPSEAEEEDEEEEASMDELKDHLFLSLLNASRSGHLLEALNKSSKGEDEDIEALRNLAQETLSEAVGSGSLEAALSSISSVGMAETEEIDSLRSNAFSTLLQGFRTGRLTDVLSTVREGADEADPDDEEEEDEEEEADDTLRTTVFATLLTGVRTGMFDKAFEQVRPSDAQEDEDEEDEESVGFEDVISLSADSESEYLEEQLESMAQTYIDVAFEEAKSTVLATLEKTDSMMAMAASESTTTAAVAAAPVAVATEAPAQEVLGNIGDFVKENMTPVNFSFFAGKFPSKRPVVEEAAPASAPPMVKEAAAPVASATIAFPLKGSSSLPALSKVPAKKAAVPHILVQGHMEIAAPSPQTPTKLGELKGVPRCFKSTPNLHFNGSSFPAGSVRPRSRGAVATFRMDGSDSEEEHTMARQPSITTSFEALGKVSFHNLAASDADASPKRSRTLKRQTSTNKQGFSAMALDLGLPGGSSSPFGAKTSSPQSSSFAPIAFGAKTKASFLPCLTPSKSGSSSNLRMMALDQPLRSPSSSMHRQRNLGLFNSSSAPSLLA